MCGMPVGGLLTSNQGRAAALGGIAGGLLAGKDKKSAAAKAGASTSPNVQSGVTSLMLGA